MRRVRNPYQSSDPSNSQSLSLSQSVQHQKSKRKIEIEKLSDNEGNDGGAGKEDSYQDDEFYDF